MSIAVPPGMDLTENKGPLFIGVFSAGLAVAFIVVALRLWVRIKLVGKVGVDDYIMTASLVRILLFNRVKEKARVAGVDRRCLSGVL